MDKREGDAQIPKGVVFVAARNLKAQTDGTNADRQVSFADIGSAEPRPRWLTVDELASYLHIGRTRAYEYVRSGRVPAVRFGTVWRIPLQVLEETLTAEAHRNLI